LVDTPSSGRLSPSSGHRDQRAIDGMSGTGYRRRDGPADCRVIARLSELNRSGARFLTPVSRASADLTQYTCPDRDVSRSNSMDRHAINITTVMQYIFADIEP
jgi:hypothetical protein